MGVNLNDIHHRNKGRIKELGEVFTPESYVEGMLDLISTSNKYIWSDENVVFFEPTCGHGNIVIPIYRRRLHAIYNQAIAKGFGKTKEAPLYAVANALNSLWAIDIDAKNIENTRSRLFQATLEFLNEKFNSRNSYTLIAKNKDFFAHLLSAIRWQISENETLSAMSSEKDAKANAGLTKSGTKWFTKNGHDEIDFDLTWVNFFESCEQANTIPLEFERASRFVEGIASGKIKGFEEFNFAKVIFENKNDRQLQVGV